MDFQDIRQLEIEQCKSDIVYFVETYVKIEDKDSDELYIPFRLWDGQKRALLDFRQYRRNIVLKARQLGLTWLALAYAAWLIVFFPGRTVVALSQTEEFAKELVARLRTILLNLGPFVRETPWAGPVVSFTTMSVKIVFPDGKKSEFKVYASSANAGRSITANLIILDEWAFQDNAHEILKAIFPTINRPSGGQVIGLSTIKLGTLFEDIFTDPDNGWHKIFLPWNTDPRRDTRWYETTCKAMGKEKAMQEYPATVEEALTLPGGKFFPEVKDTTHKADIETLHDYLKARRYVCLDYGLDMLSVHWVAVDDRNRANVYREYDESDVTIPRACELIKNLSAGDNIDLVLAPPDLWNRDQVSGKSRADIFAEYGVTLTKTNNDLEAGCAAMKVWLSVDPDTEKAYLTISDAPNLYSCLQRIQRDEKRPDVYAKQPHNLTHDPDSLRCFCVYWTAPADTHREYKRVKWEDDLWEDYYNADEAGKQYLIEKYGEPE